MCACRRVLFFFSSRRRHTRSTRDWSSDVCSSDLVLSVHRAIGRVRHEVQGPLAGDFRRRPGASDGRAQLRPRPRALHRLRLRLRARKTDDAAPWHRRPAPVLRRGPALPRAVPMKFSESWLRSFCNPSLSAAELAERLTMAGVEVESCEPAGPPQLSGVVVGEITAVKPHPNADQLTVCKVTTGKKTLQVVCGAPNVRVGMKAPLADIGGKNLRGVDSEAMLCSARELGLSDDHSGLLELPKSAKVGSDVRKVLGLDDHIFTLKLTPNRADCLCVLGVAREVSALTGAKLRAPEIKPVLAKNRAQHPAKLTAPEGCGRFAGRVIRDVNPAAPTPQWMRRRLEGAGQRSISALVDVTNYVMLELCGGEPGPSVDKAARLPKRKPVRMRVARAQKILGMPVPATEMQRAFTRLAFPVKREKDAFTVTPPSYRFDIAIEEDLIEEVARLYGFERIAAHPPRVYAAMLPAPETRRALHALRERLAAADYREVINFSFVEPGWEADLAGEANPIRLLNPIAIHQSVMRTSLMGSLVWNVRYNQARKVPRIRVFEVGRVYLRDASAQDGPLSVAGVRQPVHIGAAAYGPVLDEQWDTAARGVDFFDVKADLESLVAPLPVRFEPAAHPALHPGRSARVLVDSKPAGWIGELHPKWQQKYELPQPPVLFEMEAEPLESVPLPRPQVPSKYPPVVRDMALLFDSNTPVQAVFDAIEAEKPPIVRAVRLFSLYRGETLPPRRKSLAFRVVMQHTERTLVDAEADAARDALVALLGRKFSAILRN